MMNKNMDAYAKLDKAFALAPIFSACGSNIETPIRFTQRTPAFNIDYAASRHCGVREQSVLFGLIAKIGLGEGSPLARLTKSREPSALWTRATGNCNHKDGDILPSVAAIDVTGRELIRMAGLKSDGAENYEALKIWLDGLADVSILDHFAPGKATQHLLAFRAIERGYRIALCPRLSASALGQGGNVTIQLDERADISSAAGRLLHAKLSANLHCGAWFEIGEEKLAAAIWPVISAATYPRNWKSIVRAALSEIASVGWQVNAKNRNVIIERPRKGPKPKPKTKENIVEP